MTGLSFARFGAVLVMALVGGSAAAGGGPPLLCVVLGVQAVSAAAWVVLAQVPGRTGALIIAASTSIGCDVSVSVWPHSRTGPELAVLGLAVPALFVHQLARGAARVRVLESMGSIAALVVVEVSLAVLIPVRDEAHPDGRRVALAAVVCVCGALLAGRSVEFLAARARFRTARSGPSGRSGRSGMSGLLGLPVGGAAGALLVLTVLGADREVGAVRAPAIGAVGGLVTVLLTAAVRAAQPPAPAAVLPMVTDIGSGAETGAGGDIGGDIGVDIGGDIGSGTGAMGATTAKATGVRSAAASRVVWSLAVLEVTVPLALTVPVVYELSRAALP